MEEKGEQRVVLDLDGVLADFEGRFVQAFGANKRTKYSLFKRYPESKEEIIRFLNDPATYINLPVLQLGKQVYHRLSKAKIWFITGRPRQTVGVTQNWLDRNGFGNGTLLVGGENKFDLIRVLSPALVIDDSPNILGKCIKMRIPCLLLAQPWNSQCHDSYRIHNIMDLDRNLELLEQNHANGCFSQPG